MRKAIEYIESKAGTHFDLQLVQLFIENIDKIIAIREQYEDLTEDSIPQKIVFPLIAVSNQSSVLPVKFERAGLIQQQSISQPHSCAGADHRNNSRFIVE